MKVHTLALISLQSFEYTQKATILTFWHVQLDLHGMSVDEAVAKLDKHITSLTGLSSSTFVIQVSLHYPPPGFRDDSAL